MFSSFSKHCPNQCNGVGVCTNSSTLPSVSLSHCDCFPGFIGVDCSLRVCPSGKAWYDFPTSSVKAHTDFTECSNMVKY